MEELQILLEESIMIRFVTTNRFTGDSSGFLKGSEFIDFPRTLTYIFSF